MQERSRYQVRLAILTGVVMLVAASRADGFCGCDKPPPPRANVRPFVATPNQRIALFDDRLVPGNQYTVVFTSRDGTTEWSRGKAVNKRDQADGEWRHQLRIAVGDMPLGPCQISVYDKGALLYALGDDQLTVIAPAIALHDFTETITRDGYQTGVSADGTVYLAFDTSEVSDATTYAGVANGFDLRFEGRNVAIFNAQGFLGEVLEPQSRGLFGISRGGPNQSAALAYWRHEFRTYKEEHRHRDDRRSADGEWHADGTRHVDNFHLVVAIAGVLSDGKRPQPGVTPPFQLVLTSSPSPTNNVR